MNEAYGYILVAVLIAAGALIAYLGDLVGRKLGRRRLTIFGLRPRHTAILFSVVSGVFITIVTLGTAVLVSRDVRTGLFQVNQLRSGKERMEREAELVSGKLKALQSRYDTMQADYDRLTANLEKSSAQLTEVEGKLRDATQRLASAEQRARDAEARYQDVHGRLAGVQAQLATTEGDLHKAEAQLAQRRADLEEAKKNYDQLVAATGADLKRIQDETLRLRQERDNLEAEIAAARQNQFGAVAMLSELREGHLIYARDDEVGRDIVSADASPEVIKGQLQLLIRKLNDTAQARGARGPGGMAIVVAQLQPGDEGITVYDEETVIASLVAGVQQARRSVVVRGLAAVNTVAGQPVPLRFELLDNRVVFRAGQALATLDVSADTAELDLLLEVMRALRTAGAQARQQGVLPDLAPGAGFGDTPGDTVGDIGFDEMIAAVRRIKAVGGPARFAVVAAAETTVVGPLRVELRVESAQSRSGTQAAPSQR